MMNNDWSRKIAIARETMSCLVIKDIKFQRIIEDMAQFDLIDIPKLIIGCKIKVNIFRLFSIILVHFALSLPPKKYQVKDNYMLFMDISTQFLSDYFYPKNSFSEMEERKSFKCGTQNGNFLQ